MDNWGCATTYDSREIATSTTSVVGVGSDCPRCATTYDSRERVAQKVGDLK